MAIKSAWKSVRLQLWLGAAFAAIDLVIIGYQRDLTRSDWGTWVGSVGTVCTLIGTIWIATSERRKREREAHDLATIAAASMLFRLIEARQTLKVTVEALSDHGASADNNFLSTYNILNSAPLWSTSETTPLSILPNHAAAKLAICLADVDWCKRKMAEVLGIPSPRPPLAIGGTIKIVSPRLSSILDGLGIIEDDVTTFLKKAGFQGW